MQLNKQLISIIILSALLISAATTAFYFYKKNQTTLKNKSELVTIYIAKDDIPKETLLTVKHLAKTQIARQYILNKPLLKNEILGKYTNERIYKHEIFLKQKLDTKIKKQERKILDFKKSAYNMKFELFKNPNYALDQGEYINIVSVYPKGKTDKKGRYLDFDVKYVAPNIKVLGFIRDGRYEAETITKQKIKKVINKKLVEVVQEVKSDELILDIDLDVLLRLIKNYNLGTQLWMTKTKEQAPKKIVMKKEEKKITKEKTSAEKKTEEKPRKYLFKLYKPSINTIKRKAVIDYANDEEKENSKTKQVDIIVNPAILCESIKDKFVIGKVKAFNIRSSASTKSKYKKVYMKNTIIPYISKVGDWYKTCDKKYVHKNVVKKVSPQFVERKLGTYGY